MPRDLLAAYGAGVQVHVEDLASYLAGGERCDADARWQELIPGYQDLAEIGSAESLTRTRCAHHVTARVGKRR